MSLMTRPHARGSWCKLPSSGLMASTVTVHGHRSNTCTPHFSGGRPFVVSIAFWTSFGKMAGSHQVSACSGRRQIFGWPAELGPSNTVHPACSWRRVARTNLVIKNVSRWPVGWGKFSLSHKSWSCFVASPHNSVADRADGPRCLPLLRALPCHRFTATTGRE